MIPDWPPDLCQTNGGWQEVVAGLYAVFRRDLVETTPFIDGIPVWYDRRMSEGFEESFWHLITRTDYSSGERLLDTRRAGRLSWCGAILQNANHDAVKRWRYREDRGRIRLYLWYEAGEYVVILEEKTMRRGNVYFLTTAYYVEGDSGRRNLRRKYDAREP